jgi:hypothetical protein
MSNLKKQYRDIEQRVIRELRDKVEKSDVESEFVNAKAIKVNNLNGLEYVELTIVHDKLTFIDKKGLQYSLFNGDNELEDLIDILECE